MTLLPTEYAEDLQFKGMSIILSRDLPSFTTDAVLLSDFARVSKKDTVADLGTGTGIIPLLMYGRYSMQAVGFEIQPELCDMAMRSFELNGLSDMLRAVNMDYTEAYREYNGAFSAVVCNPPYFESGAGESAKNESRAKSRSQIYCALDDIMQAAGRLLKSGGKCFFCYPAAQLCDLIFYMRKNSLEPKRMRFVRARKDKSPYLVLVEARKDGGKSLFYEDDLIISNDDGTETDEIKRIYHREA